MSELGRKFYDIANEIVGKVGESTNSRYSVTGEEYAEFGMLFNDPGEISPCWEQWIKSYKFFVKHNMVEGFYTGKSVTIYWRVLPEFREYKNFLARIYDDKFPLVDGGYTFYARLLISLGTPQYIHPL